MGPPFYIKTLARPSGRGGATVELPGRPRGRWSARAPADSVIKDTFWGRGWAGTGEALGVQRLGGGLGAQEGEGT